MKRFVFLIITAIFFAIPNAGNADLATYDVDLSGNDPNDSHFLRVFGTISLDANLAVGSAVVSSSLQMEHNDGLGGATTTTMLMGPQYVGDVSGLDWTLDASNNLYIDRTSSVSGGVLWTDATSFFQIFQLGSGPNAHSLASLNPDADTVVLKAITGPDGPNGYLVGTLAIPEPASALILTVFACAVSLRRKRIG